MIVLLDSNILIDVLLKVPSGIATLREVLKAGRQLSTSAICVGELYSGARPHELNATRQLFEEMEIIPVSFDIARRAGELRNAAARKGRTFELDDMLIAATALEYGMLLATKNTKDFKGTGVTFFGAQIA